ncbi:MAG: D-alanyl-D-alanine carboxypeptidase family protein [Clostridia bacterium]|nr:D-alanyl-D-alanine carboxypeptidase family protein [Clostridia bacterium]
MRLIRWIRLLVTAVLCILSVGGAAEKLDPTVLEQAQPVQFADFAEWNYALPLELLEGNEYIVLANQERLLEEDYIPDALVKLTCRKISSDPIQMVDAAAGALSSMFDAAKEEGIVLYAHSGYRSYRTQKTMYYNRLKKNGGKDDGVVAYPGSSDHQTGLGIDVINKAGIGKGLQAHLRIPKKESGSPSIAGSMGLSFDIKRIRKRLQESHLNLGI